MAQENIVWQYKWKFISVDKFNDQQGIQEVFNILNNLGMDGWELVSTVPIIQQVTDFQYSAVETVSVLYTFKKRV